MPDSNQMSQKRIKITCLSQPLGMLIDRCFTDGSNEYNWTDFEMVPPFKDFLLFKKKIQNRENDTFADCDISAVNGLNVLVVSWRHMRATGTEGSLCTKQNPVGLGNK